MWERWVRSWQELFDTHDLCITGKVYTKVAGRWLFLFRERRTSPFLRLSCAYGGQAISAATAITLI